VDTEANPATARDAASADDAHCGSSTWRYGLVSLATETGWALRVVLARCGSWVVHEAVVGEGYDVSFAPVGIVHPLAGRRVMVPPAETVRSARQLARYLNGAVGYEVERLSRLVLEGFE
jgi:hypothetical protein